MFGKQTEANHRNFYYLARTINCLCYVIVIHSTYRFVIRTVYRHGDCTDAAEEAHREDTCGILRNKRENRILIITLEKKFNGTLQFCENF